MHKAINDYAHVSKHKRNAIQDIKLHKLERYCTMAVV